MEPRRKGEGREDGRPIEGPFGAQEGELAACILAEGDETIPACVRAALTPLVRQLDVLD